VKGAASSTSPADGEGDDAKRAAQRFGAEAEQWVASELVREGWDVLARNWRCDGGELDLVVERDGVLRFVEVKARALGDDSGQEAVGERKQRILRRAADLWLDQRGLPAREAAFLVVLVERGPEGFRAEWIDDAF
jgi:putative endonuclease